MTKNNQGIPDSDNPEWVAEDFKSARPLKEGFPDLHALLKRRGRPKVESPKRSKTFKLSQDVIDGIRASGKGYNARVDEVLRAALSEGRI